MPKIALSLNITQRLTRWMGVATFYLFIVGTLSNTVGLVTWDKGDEVAAILSFAMGILIVLRTNTSYDRWWEARKQWGQLVNDSRNLALKARAHADLSEQEHHDFDRLLIAFPHSLRLHLRGSRDLQSVPGMSDCTVKVSHPPGYIAGLIHQTLNRWNRAGKLAETIWILDHHARALLDICGACERIQSTPLAVSYRSLVRWSLFLYTLIIPWSISLDGGWSGLLVLVVGLAFGYSMELTAEAIEDPFGTDGDDLPLDAICTGIETFILEQQAE